MLLRGHDLSAIGLRAGCTATFCLAAAAPAQASAHGLFGLDPFVAFLTLSSLAVFGWAFVTIKRMSRGLQKNRARVSELEYKLNQAESALASEAQALIVWHGKEERAGRVLNTLHGTLHVPGEADQLLAFSTWLEPDSAAMVASNLAVLRERGKPFNIGLAHQEQ